MLHISFSFVFTSFSPLPLSPALPSQSITKTQTQNHKATRMCVDDNYRSRSTNHLTWHTWGKGGGEGQAPPSSPLTPPFIAVVVGGGKTRSYSSLLPQPSNTSEHRAGERHTKTLVLGCWDGVCVCWYNDSSARKYVCTQVCVHASMCARKYVCT